MEVPTATPLRNQPSSEVPPQIDTSAKRSNILARIVSHSLNGADLSEVEPAFEPLPITSCYEAPRFSADQLQHLHRASLKVVLSPKRKHSTTRSVVNSPITVPFGPIEKWVYESGRPVALDVFAGMEVPACSARVCRTPEYDHEWCERQKSFKHPFYPSIPHPMPRKATNFCPELGMYVQQNWEPRDGDCSLITAKVIAEYSAKHLRDWADDLKYQREHPKKYDLNKFETRFLKSGDSLYQNSFAARAEAGYPEVVEGLGEVVVGDDKRKSLAATWEEASNTQRNGINAARRGKELFDAKRPERYIPPTISRCVFCGATVNARKGTKYCLKKDCRQRHHRELNAA